MLTFINISILSLGVEKLLTPKVTRDESEKLKDQLVSVEFTYYPKPLDYDPNQLVLLEITCPLQSGNPQTHFSNFPVLVSSHALHTLNILGLALILVPYPIIPLDNDQIVPEEILKEMSYPKTFDMEPNPLVPLEITYPTQPVDPQTQAYTLTVHVPAKALQVINTFSLAFILIDPNQDAWITYPEPLDFGPIELVPLKIANPTPLYDDPNQLVPVEITYPTSLDYDPNLILPLEITYSPHIHTFNVHVPAHALETIKLFLISGLISDKKTIKNLLAIPQDVAERQFQSVIDIWIKQISKHSISEWEQYKMHSGPLKTLVKEPLEPSEPSESSEQSEPLEPLEPSEPLKPSGPLEPSEPLESSEASESSEPQSNPRYIFLALPSQDFFTYVICNEIKFFLYIYMF